MRIFEKFARFFMRNKLVNKSEFVDEKFKTICFFSNTAIGDTLFNTPVFRVFKQNFPDVKTIALLNPKNYKIFKNDPNLDEIILYDGRLKGFFHALKKLKKYKIDIVFLLHSNEPQATPLAVLSGARYVFKVGNLKNSFNNFHSNRPCDVKDGYVVLSRLANLEFVGIKSTDTRMQIYLDENDFDKAKKALGRGNLNGKIIGFQMGASTLSRQWFKERWIELARLILRDESYKIVLTGSPNERYLTDEFAKEFEHEINSGRILNLAGVLDICSACALISFFDVFVTPDTGPLHVAASLKTPTVALFVAGNYLNSNPDFDKDIHKFIQKEKTCVPCIGKRCKNQICMLQITSNEVYEKIMELL